MKEKYFKVLRADSLSTLQKLLAEAKNNGWEPVGHLDCLNDEFAQPIKYKNYEDDTTEIMTAWKNSDE